MAVTAREPDQDPALPGVPLEQLDGPADAFATALDRGRLHHAWLLTGPRGLGKAALAHRAARRLLGARDAGDGVLSSNPEDPVNRLIRARSHPDFVALDRFGDDGKLRRNISVEDVRRLPEFFSKAPALAPYRVAVIDAADDLNGAAANALLKTLEEPPPRGVLFLISHSPGSLLPTIRSRCRRLAFRPWTPELLASLVERCTGLAPAESFAVAQMAGGSPGRALSMASGDAEGVDRSAQALLASLPVGDEALFVNLADGFRGGEGAERFALLIERICDRIASAVRNPALPSSVGRNRWVEAWQRLHGLPGEAEGLNLDRADAFWSAIAELRAAARLSPLPE